MITIKKKNQCKKFEKKNEKHLNEFNYLESC